MPPRRRDFQGAFGTFLAFHIAQIAAEWGRQDLACLRRAQNRPPGEMTHDFVQGIRRQNRRRPDPGRLRPAGFRAQQRLVFFRRCHCRRQCPQNRDQPPVQRQFTQSNRGRDLFFRDDLQRGQNRQSNRQVEMRAFLGHVGGRQIDRDFLRRQRNRHRRQRRLDPFARL